jgi:hypothetical protein
VPVDAAVDCVNFSKIFFLRNVSKIENQICFYTFGILTTKMTTKLASIEINDEILSKVGGIRIFFGKNL